MFKRKYCLLYRNSSVKKGYSTRCNQAHFKSMINMAKRWGMTNIYRTMRTHYMYHITMIIWYQSEAALWYGIHGYAVQVTCLGSRLIDLWYIRIYGTSTGSTCKHTVSVQLRSPISIRYARECIRNALGKYIKEHVQKDCDRYTFKNTKYKLREGTRNVLGKILEEERVSIHIRFNFKKDHNK